MLECDYYEEYHQEISQRAEIIIELNGFYRSCKVYAHSLLFTNIVLSN